MSKQYIRRCPVKLIGKDLREVDLGDISTVYPCAMSADLDASIWLVLCHCGVEFTCHADKLLDRQVTSCGQCVENGKVQSEVAYLDRTDCYEMQ